MNLSSSIYILEKNGSLNFTINGLSISKTNCVKDLGVYVSSSGKFSMHYDKITSKAYKTLGLL